MTSWPFKTFHPLKMEIFDKRVTLMLCWLQGKVWLFLDVSLNTSIMRTPNLWLTEAEPIPFGKARFRAMRYQSGENN